MYKRSPTFLKKRRLCVGSWIENIPCGQCLGNITESENYNYDYSNSYSSSYSGSYSSSSLSGDNSENKPILRTRSAKFDFQTFDVCDCEKVARYEEPPKMVSEWSSWSSWTPCPITCKRTRTRKCPDNTCTGSRFQPSPCEEQCGKNIYILYGPGVQGLDEIFFSIPPLTFWKKWGDNLYLTSARAC